MTVHDHLNDHEAPDPAHGREDHRHSREAGHSHSHGASGTADVRYLAVALGLIFGFMVVEVTVSFISGSLALLADAGHMLTDAGALAASLWAIRLAARPATVRWTYGLKRAEILSAAGNGVTLLVVAALVAFESIRRLVHPPAVAGTDVLIVALVGVAVNILAAWVLAKANRSSLNVEGSFRHILTDLYGFIGTVIAAIVIITTGYRRADPIASLIVVALMAKASWELLAASGRVLLESAPDALDLDKIRAHLMENHGVIEVHDLHAWTLTSDMHALSAHIVVEPDCIGAGHTPQILDRLQACVLDHFDVEHSTFQLEAVGHQGHEHSTHQ